MLQKSFGDGRKSLIFIPGDIYLALKFGGKGPEYETASFGCVHKMLECQKAAKAFSGKAKEAIESVGGTAKVIE